MPTFHFTNVSKKQFRNFDKQTQDRILKKLQELKNHPSIFEVLEPLTNLEPATHRLRIGEYRLLLRMAETMCVVEKIGHRREIYR